MEQLRILDGGMGRELKRMGAPFSQPLWSAQALIESPDLVYEAHRNFINAGAEIIIVNSYACVPFHLGKDGYRAQGAQLANTAAKIARRAVDDTYSKSGRKVIVAGCLPPVFGSYRPDLFKPDEASSIYRELIDAQDKYIDIWIAETISSTEEFECISTALKENHKDQYFAFSLDDNDAAEASLRSGESITLALERLSQTSASGIMFNCSIPEVMGKAISDSKLFLQNRDRNMSIGVYANAFTPISGAHKANSSLQTMRECSYEEYLDFVKQWHKLGATVIGGCCGIGPEHIKSISDWKNSNK